MPEPVTLAIAAASTFFGVVQQKKANKQAKASAALQGKARETDNKIAAVRAAADRQDRLRKKRALVAANIARSFQGATGGGSSTTAAANSGIITNTAVNLGRQSEVQQLGVERNQFLQGASDLNIASNISSTNAGFLFQVAQQTAPTKQEFQDLFGIG